MGEAYHKKQIASCVSAKVTLNIEINSEVKKYPKIF